MAISASSRLGITRWSADTDQVGRAQFDGDHGKLDDLAAMDMQGTLANRPAASAANRGLFYTVVGDATAANNGKMYRSDGTGWLAIFSGQVAAADITYAGSTNLASTNVEAALDELDAEKVRGVVGITVATTAPTGPATNDLWVDTA